jgi:hypothetical protein
MSHTLSAPAGLGACCRRAGAGGAGAQLGRAAGRRHQRLGWVGAGGPAPWRPTSCSTAAVQKHLPAGLLRAALQRRRAARLPAQPPPPMQPPCRLPFPQNAGGISPVTRDFVNPEKPWRLAPLAAATAAAGRCLVPRLPLYPPYLLDLQGRWLDGSGGGGGVGAAARRLADSSGLVRGSGWCPGQPEEQREELQGEGAGAAGAGAAAAAAGGSSLPSAVQPEEQARSAEQRGDGQEASSSSSSSSGGGGGGLQQRSSMPAVRARQQQLWRVSMADDGTMEVRACLPAAQLGWLPVAGLRCSLFQAGHEHLPLHLTHPTHPPTYTSSPPPTPASAPQCVSPQALVAQAAPAITSLRHQHTLPAPPPARPCRASPPRPPAPPPRASWSRSCSAAKSWARPRWRRCWAPGGPTWRRCAPRLTRCAGAPAATTSPTLSTATSTTPTWVPVACL